jgi:hypothetical protein
VVSLHRATPHRSAGNGRDPQSTPVLHPFDQLRIRLIANELAGADIDLRPLGGVPGAEHVPPEGSRVPIVVPTGTLMNAGAGQRGNLGSLVLSATRGQPVVGVGLGAAPATRAVDRALARHFAARTRLLVMRSEAAARRLALAGASSPIRVGADLAWLQPTLASGPERADQLLVIGDPPDAFVARALAGSLPAAAGEGVGLVLGRWQGRGDTALLVAALVGRIRGAGLEVLPAWPDAGSALATAAHSLAVVALDTDAQLIAALTRTPAVVISDDEECLALADDLGYPALPPAVGGRRLRSALGAVAGRPWQGGSGVEGFRDRARDSLNLVQLVVSAGGPGHDAPRGAAGESRGPARARGLLLWPEPTSR